MTVQSMSSSAEYYGMYNFVQNIIPASDNLTDDCHCRLPGGCKYGMHGQPQSVRLHVRHGK